MESLCNEEREVFLTALRNLTLGAASPHSLCLVDTVNGIIVFSFLQKMLSPSA